MGLAAKLGALHEREFRLFFLGQSASLLGAGMVGVALSFAVLDTTGSVTPRARPRGAVDPARPPRRRRLFGPAVPARRDGERRPSCSA
jgi:hypothetical protein